MGNVDALPVPSDVREGAVEHDLLSDGDLRTLLDYEKRFLAARKVAEKLYCRRCFQDNRADGCRVSVTQNGFTGMAHIECRCRILERKGLVS